MYVDVGFCVGWLGPGMFSVESCDGVCEAWSWSSFGLPYC